MGTWRDVFHPIGCELSMIFYSIAQIAMYGIKLNPGGRIIISRLSSWKGDGLSHYLIFKAKPMIHQECV